MIYVTILVIVCVAGSDLWMTFARELMCSKQFCNKSRCKWFAFMSFTMYAPPPDTLPQTHSDVLRFTQGHTALGRVLTSVCLYLIIYLKSRGPIHEANIQQFLS